MFLCVLTKQAHNSKMYNALRAVCAARAVCAVRCAVCAVRCAVRFVRAARAVRCAALQKKISAHLCAYFLQLLYSFVNCVQHV